MIKSCTAFACVAAVALSAATGVQACGNPADALRAEPTVTKAETRTQHANTKDQPATLQGDKR